MSQANQMLHCTETTHHQRIASRAVTACCQFDHLYINRGTYVPRCVCVPTTHDVAAKPPCEPRSRGPHGKAASCRGKAAYNLVS